MSIKVRDQIRKVWKVCWMQIGKRKKKMKCKLLNPSFSVCNGVKLGTRRKTNAICMVMIVRKS